MLEKHRERQRRYRERLADKQKEKEKQVVTPKPKKTRAQEAKAADVRERNRISAKKMRDNYSAQKRCAVNRKRMKRYYTQKLEGTKAQDFIEEGNRGSITSGSEDEGNNSENIQLMSKAAVASAVKRVKRRMTKQKNKFVQIVKGLITSSDKSTKEMFREQNVCFSPTSASLKKKMQTACTEMGKKRNKASLFIRKNLFDTLGESKLVGRTKMKRCGEHYMFLKRKRDTVNEFLENVATEVPEQRAVNKFGVAKKVLPLSMASVHKRYCSTSTSKVSLRTFYRYRPKHILPVSQNKFRMCICEICYNPKTKLRVVNSFQTQREKLDLDGLIEKTLCKAEGVFHRIECVQRVCKLCGVDGYRDQYLRTLPEAALAQPVSYHVWEQVKEGASSKMMKVKKQETLQSLVFSLFENLRTLALHKFTEQWQRKQFYVLKSNLPPKALLVIVDFAENYTCRNQDEAQSAYWGYTQATVHPTVVHRLCECGEIATHNLVFLSEDLKHDAHIVNSFFKKTVEYMKTVDNVESCSEVKAEKVFYGARHGKNACDALGGVVKSLCTSLVRSESEVISNAQDMFNICSERFQKCEIGACGKVHKERVFFLVKGENVDRSMSSDQLKTIPGTRSVHHVRAIRQDVIATRKLACFCLACLKSEGVAGDSDCENKALVGDWDVVKLQKANTCTNDIAKSAPNSVKHQIQKKEISLPVRHIKPGAFHMIMWEGKSYVAQILEVDDDAECVRVNYMKWSVGRLQWGEDDTSWEEKDDIGAEVVLNLDERASNSRIQSYNYSLVM